MQRWSLFLIGAMGVGACSHAVRAPADGRISFNSEPGAPLPFDPHGRRVGAALDRLAQVTGHPVTLDLDVALLRAYRAWFETGLTTALEDTARDLGEIKRTRAEGWAAMGPKIKKLSFAFDEKAHKVVVVLDDARETLQITVPAGATAFLPHDAALLALEAQYDAGLPEKYAAGVPVRASVAEKRAYVRALTGQKPPPRKSDDPAYAPGVANEVRPTAILRAIRFYDVAMPAELKAEIHEWILNEGNYFRDAYIVYPDAVKTSPQVSPFHRAEAAWIDWTQKDPERFTDLERITLAKLVFTKIPAKDRSAADRAASLAFPGFDRVAFGLRVFEEWIGAGHPRFIPGRDRLLELFDRIICPFEIDDRGAYAKPTMCEHDFYRVAAESEANQKRFFDFLLAQKDEVLVETTFLNYMRLRDMRTVLTSWRALEPDEIRWKAATRAIADELRRVDTARFQDDASRLWQSDPKRRATLLYLLSQIDRYGNDRVAWGAWADSGARASAADFKAFLEHGRRAVATAWVVWPLLGRGWSRADVLLPLLDAFIDDRLVAFYHPQDPTFALHQMVNRMCAEKNYADLGKVHAYFVERVRKIPSDETTFADLIEDTLRARCRPNARPVVRVTPLDD